MAIYLHLSPKCNTRTLQRVQGSQWVRRPFQCLPSKHCYRSPINQGAPDQWRMRVGPIDITKNARTCPGVRLPEIETKKGLNSKHYTPHKFVFLVRDYNSNALDRHQLHPWETRGVWIKPCRPNFTCRGQYCILHGQLGLSHILSFLLQFTVEVEQ